MLTSREAKVISSLASAWSLYLQLPPKSSEDNVKFKASLEAAQSIIVGERFVDVTQQTSKRPRKPR